MELESLELYEELQTTVDEVGYLLLLRQVHEGGNDKIDSQLDELMVKFNVDNLDDLEELIENQYLDSRKDSLKYKDNELLTQRDLKWDQLQADMVKEHDLLSDMNKSREFNLERKSYIQSLINELMDIEELIEAQQLEQNEEFLNRKHKLIQKNILMSSFITDLISSITSIDIALHEELVEILLDCGDHSMYH